LTGTSTFIGVPSKVNLFVLANRRWPDRWLFRAVFASAVWKHRCAVASRRDARQTGRGFGESSPRQGRWLAFARRRGRLAKQRFRILPLRHLRCHLPLAGEDRDVGDQTRRKRARTFPSEPRFSRSQYAKDRAITPRPSSPLRRSSSRHRRGRSRERSRGRSSRGSPCPSRRSCLRGGRRAGPRDSLPSPRRRCRRR
jgi:hypothetical protein